MTAVITGEFVGQKDSVQSLHPDFKVTVSIVPACSFSIYLLFLAIPLCVNSARGTDLSEECFNLGMEQSCLF